MIEKLDVSILGPAGARYYAEKRLLRVVQQYYELPADESQALVAALIAACLKLWFGRRMKPLHGDATYSQDFWLRGPERVLRIWVRVSEPQVIDTIATLEEIESARPSLTISACVGQSDTAED